MNLLPGTILAQRYRIDALLGEGGMGAVYRATDSRGGGFALKVLRSECLADADIRRRFEQEAHIGLRLRHPNVRQVWEIGVDRHTQLPYLAMELLSGEDLATRLAWRGFLSRDEVGHLFGQLCDALSSAHGVGIVHRDLKPENLFLSASYGGGEALKILDFGIAKMLTGRATNSIVIGTPAWMAPEQLGADLEVGPHTDVWAIGLLAFFALTGRSYWPAANAKSSDYPKIILDVVNPASRVPASRRAAEYGLSERVPPGDFDAWFAACTAVSPRERFQDVPACWTALRTVLGAQAAVSGSAIHRTMPVLVDDEEVLVQQAIAEIQKRMPNALAAAADGALQPPRPRDSVPSQPRSRISLVKGGTPTPAPITPVPPSVSFGPGGAHAMLQPQIPLQAQPAPLSVWVLPADKGLRLGALIFDQVLIVVAALLLAEIAEQIVPNVVGYMFVALFWFGYMFRDLVGGGRSLGKRAFKLEIIDVRTGIPVGLGEAIGRHMLSLETLPGFGLFDSILVLAREDGRRSGDLFLHTQVVQRKTTPY
jgi:serine/threonine-protein kinase